MSMDSGMRRQRWNGVVDLIFCAILVVLSFLGMMQDFMQVFPDVYIQPMRDAAEDADDSALGHKVKATVAGCALTICFALITALLTILAYPCPYDKMRCPVNFFPYLFFVSSIITIVASVLTYIEIADNHDEQAGADIKPYTGFVCCLLSGVMAIMFLCVRSCYKPVPKEGGAPNNQPLNSGYDQQTQHTRV
eukprot:TRINITY_DN5302_c0_g1_i1.p1 TRINITY_DN5302_c0_g1~~TRINITY_DN5302_c0_g1_i1.p1  ORF type:complete len:209 (+),score=31.17 TRINITY_DN5302_c0_g1_i1:52-627(+)